MAAGGYCLGMYLPIICDVHERSGGEFLFLFVLVYGGGFQLKAILQREV